MNRIHRRWERGPQTDLQRVIEPLASYICAADRPRAALQSALAALLSEVAQTNRAANVHVNLFSESKLS
jgi:hypothetical protein